MNIRIRILTPADAKAYRELRLYSYRKSPFAFSESYEDEVQRSVEEFAADLQCIGDPPEQFVLGAFAGEQLIGFLTFKRDKRIKGRHKSMLHAMYTHPDHRMNGVGSQLVQTAIQMAKAIAGLEQIHLWVLHATTSASVFYLKSGFESQGTMVKNDLKIGDVYIDAEYMVLYL